MAGDLGLSGGPIPGENGYAFPTWRDAIAEAQGQIEWAYDRRRRVFQTAFRAGLTCRQIGEAAGMSAAGVHKIIGRQSADLDVPATTVDASEDRTPSRGLSGGSP